MRLIFFLSNPSGACQSAMHAADSQMPKGIDYYDVYAPICTTSTKQPGQYTSLWNKRPWAQQKAGEGYVSHQIRVLRFCWATTPIGPRSNSVPPSVPSLNLVNSPFPGR